MRRMNWFLLSIFFVAILAGLPGCPPRNPELTITKVPPYGQYGFVEGRAKYANIYDFKVIMYITVNGLCYIKPYDNNYNIYLQSNGAWSANMTTDGVDQLATAVDVFLVPIDFVPPLCNPCQELPQIPEAVAQAHHTRYQEPAGEGEGEGEASEGENEGEGEEPVAIWIDHIPALGSWSDTLSGGVSGVDASAYQVSIYIEVGQSWWVKPFEDNPLIDISQDGSWSLNPATGGDDNTADSYAAFLVPRGSSVPDCVPCDTKPSPAAAIASCEQSRS